MAAPLRERIRKQSDTPSPAHLLLRCDICRHTVQVPENTIFEHVKLLMFCGFLPEYVKKSSMTTEAHNNKKVVDFPCCYLYGTKSPLPLPPLVHPVLWIRIAFNADPAFLGQCESANFCCIKNCNFLSPGLCERRPSFRISLQPSKHESSSLFSFLMVFFALLHPDLADQNQSTLGSS